MNNSISRILIVSDVENDTKQMCHFFSENNYHVTVLKNYDSVIKICIQHDFDLIILDFDLVGASGIEMCQKIKNLLHHDMTPIIPLTHRNNESFISRVLKAGAVNILFKPLHWDMFRQCVTNAFQSQELFKKLTEKEQELFVSQSESKIGTIRIFRGDDNIELSSHACFLLGIAEGKNTINIHDFCLQVDEKDRQYVKLVLQRAIDTLDDYSVEYTYRTDAGQQLIIHQQGKPSKQRSNSHWLMGTLQDVTIVRDNQKAYERQRKYDQLTGVYNKEYFETFVGAILDNPPEDSLFAVIFVGIDSFTDINFSLGHSGGDFVLKTVADRLLNYADKNRVVSRFGGDVFSLLVKKIYHIDESDRIFEQILASIRQPIYFKGQEIFITASLGASIFPIESEDAISLFNGAESAMIGSRDSGGNMFTYRTAAMNKRALKRSTILREMRDAINNENFVAYFQPQIDSQTMSITGMESLVRWLHPDRGCILPAEFIELAEETGLIIPIGEQILWQACLKTKQWLDKGYKLRVSVNVSARQFADVDMCRLIDKVLSKTMLPPDALEIEITETVAIHNLESTIKKLNGIREMGVRTSMDDFGTGYSSLSQIHQLPLDTLKVDQAFVREIKLGSNDHYENTAIANAIIAMAHSMELNVVSEGVETIDQLNFLLMRKSEILQGFLFSKPVISEKFESLLSRDFSLELLSRDLHKVDMTKISMH